MRSSLIRRMIMAPLYMPPEWAPHRACFILYPHNTGVFRSDANGVKCGPAREEVRNIARAICYKGKEDVFLCCNTEEEANSLKDMLAKEEQAPPNCPYRIKVQVCDSDDSWCRDSGPTFVLNTDSGKMVGLDWDFNAYGGPEEGCYWPCDKDRLVAGRMVDIVAKEYNIDVDHVKVPEIILEGGSFHTDGEGTILTTEECLLNPNRNPQLTKDEIEKIVLEKLGAEKMIWLPNGIAFDNDTNGHVDNIATFVRPGEVVLSWTNDQSDVNWDRFNAALNVLNKEVDAKGRKIRVHLLHVPDPMYYAETEVSTIEKDEVDAQAQDRVSGERLAGSYVNYYLANEAVILCQFGDSKFDMQAIETMKTIYPDKEIVGVYSREVLLGGGNIHCITQQVPKL